MLPANSGAFPSILRYCPEYCGEVSVISAVPSPVTVSLLVSEVPVNTRESAVISPLKEIVLPPAFEQEISLKSLSLAVEEPFINAVSLPGFTKTETELPIIFPPAELSIPPLT